MALTDRQRAMADEALARARGSLAMSNYPAIVQGFLDKGIPAEEIEPRVNVLTYQAWRAANRQVRKGEHGVKVVTWIPVMRTETNAETGESETREGKRPWTATVFHVSQTDAIN
jgi:hypothetical protein